jgi:hypothetical protein
MFRRLSALALAAGLVAAQSGCMRCDRPGLFTSGSRERPAILTGGNAGCFDAAGQPCPCPPGAPATVVPGGAFPGDPFPPGPTVRPDELHMPAPTELIPPRAIPIPAPGDAVLPPPASPGVPVKNR